MERVVKKLIELNKTISTMESCTGGGVANAITNVPNSSWIFKYGAVTYSNEFKEKMGVDSKIIEEYTVYSMETANEMSLKISQFTDSDYGIGVTGKLNRIDEANPYGDDGLIFISVYDKENDNFYNREVKAIKEARSDNKELIIDGIIDMMLSIL
jgi:PncC family amidohydrolase